MVRIIKSILSAVLSILLIANWIWGLLIFADMPSIYTEQFKNDVDIIIYLFAISFIVLIIEIIVIKIAKIRGSYLVLLFGILSLLLWGAQYNGFNFTTREAIINLYDKRIVTSGIVLGVLSIGSQLLQISLYYWRKR